MKKLLYDVECFSNVFLCSFKDYKTKELITYEISHRRNQYRAFKSFMSYYKDYLISFNGIHYDNCIVLWVIQNEYTLNTLGVEEFLLQLKNFSDMIIHNDFWYHDKKMSKYKYHNQWIDVDLYTYWSKMLRLSKKISLKGLAVQLNYDTIQELPFHPDTYLTSQEIDELAHYNRVHDLNILELLLLEKIEEVKLRIYIQKEYGLKCMSFDAPKIASELLLQEYCKITNNNIKDVRSERFTHDSKLELPVITFVLSIFQDIYNDMCKAFDSYEKEIAIVKNNTSLKLSYGKGGIHSVNKNEKYVSTDTELIITSDVASLYPQLIINYKLLRFIEVLQLYINVKEDRIEAKKTNKAKDTLLKLILNSTSGLIDNTHSWLYYPEGAMKLRLTGQLLLTLAIERLILSNFKVISANTDGIETIVPKEREQEYYNIVDQVGKEYNLIFEHEIYNEILYSNVNSYLAKTIKGKIKQKGQYVEKPELGNSVDFLIIPKALNAYFIHNIPYVEFILKHNNIFDFCASKKVGKQYEIFWTTPNGIKSKQQRLNRFYASTKGGYLMKLKKQSEQHILKDSGVMIYNNHLSHFPTDINYQYYINKVREIVNDFENQQLKLF